MLQIQRVLSDLYEDVSGEALPDSNAQAFASKWLDSKQAEIHPRTLVFYRIKVDSFMKFLGAKAKGAMRELTTEDVRRWRDSEAKRLTASTANHGLKCIRMYFAAARRHNLIADDHSKGVFILKKPQETTRCPFTLSELETLLKVAPQKWRSLILFGLYTGQTFGDLATLTWEQIDLDHNEIRLKTRKTSRNQKIPICTPLLAHIQGRPEPSTRSKPVHPDADAQFKMQGRSGVLSRQFYELMTKAGLVEKKSHHKS